MKAKKPSYQQRKLIEKANLDTYVWYVQKDTPMFMQLKNINTGETKTISKTDT